MRECNECGATLEGRSLDDPSGLCMPCYDDTNSGVCVTCGIAYGHHASDCSCGGTQ